MDYLFRWLAAKFVKQEPALEEEPVATAAATDEIKRVGDVVAAAQKVEVIDVSAANGKNGKNGHNGHTNGNGGTSHTGNGNYSFIARTDAPTCPECGSIMIPNGSCHKCVNCGTTSGCS
jgi:ribonucleoside-diphosphate reductase alpha chain